MIHNQIHKPVQKIYFAFNFVFLMKFQFIIKVDLNRNWAAGFEPGVMNDETYADKYAFSQPETQILREVRKMKIVNVDDKIENI